MSVDTIAAIAPWVVLLGYCAIVTLFSPKRVSAPQFFGGGAENGAPPGLWLLAFSAAITWVFAKSIANAAGLSKAFGILGGIGYATYYFSFAVVAVVIYLLRTRGGYTSLPGFLVAKYGPVCARLFLIAIAIRLFNEVWSNTKVAGLYFGPEGKRSVDRGAEPSSPIPRPCSRASFLPVSSAAPLFSCSVSSVSTENLRG